MKNYLEVINGLNKELQTLEDKNRQNLESLKGSFLDKKNTKEWKEYKDNSSKIEVLKKDILNLKQSNHLESVNNFHNIINTLVPELQKYEGSFINKDGSAPKKFKDFLSKIDLQGLHVYSIQRYSFSDVEIVFSGSNGLEHTIEIGNLESFENLKNYDIVAVLKAQEEHNNLLIELETLQKKVNENYLVATAEWNINHSGKNYKF